MPRYMPAEAVDEMTGSEYETPEDNEIDGSDIVLPSGDEDGYPGYGGSRWNILLIFQSRNCGIASTRYFLIIIVIIETQMLVFIIWTQLQNEFRDITGLIYFEQLFGNFIIFT